MKPLSTVAIISIASLSFTTIAQAQVVVPPGQDFYATPISKDGVSAPQGRIVAAAPAAKKAGGKKHRVMRRKTKR